MKKILNFMREESYAPMTSEELVDALGHDVNPTSFGMSCWRWSRTARLLKHALKHTACRRKWAWLPDVFS